MTERLWRLLLGISIILFLSFDLDNLLLGLVVWLYFEAITNIRITKLVSRVRYGKNYITEMEKKVASVHSTRIINFEAERMLRLMMATALLFTFKFDYLFDLSTNPIWFLPWLVGLMLLSAGLTSICPMLMVFQWLGFKPKYH